MLRRAGVASVVLATSCSRALSTMPKFVVSVDGAASLTDQSSKDFLLTRPAGAYTTARTCSGARRLFEWTTHVERTAASAAAMLNDPASPVAPAPSVQPTLLAELGNAERLRPRLDATVGAAVREYCANHGEIDELKVTLLVSWAADAGCDASGSIACHIQPLPPLPSPPVKVEVRGAPRANAAAKDSSWVADRAPLEALKRADINELLLASESGELLEGSQTNVRDSLVQAGVVEASWLGRGVVAG